MSDQKINITLTADNSDLKKAVEDSTNKLLHLGESGQEAMDRTAIAWDDFLWEIPMATAATCWTRHIAEMAELPPDRSTGRVCRNASSTSANRQ